MVEILVVLLVVMVLGAKEMTEAGLSQEEETGRIELLEGWPGWQGCSLSLEEGGHTRKYCI